MFNLLKKVSALKVEIKNLKNEVEGLKDTKSALERTMRGKEHARKLDDDRIKHLMKMKEEALELQHRRAVMDEQAKTAEAIAKVKDEYQLKQEETLNKHLDRLNGMYKDVLSRLPHVTALIENGTKPGKK